MFKKRLVLFYAVISLQAGAQHFEALYTFANVSSTSGTVSPGPLPEVTGLSLGSFTAFGVAGNPNASGRFSFTGWPVGAGDGADNYGTYTAALSPFAYYEVSLEAKNGYSLELESMKFSVRRSGTGIRTYCVRSSLNNFSGNLSASTGTSSNLSVIPDDVFFWKFDNTSTASDQRGSEVTFDADHDSLTGIIHLRIYAWNAEAGNGTFSIDDVVISGTLRDSTWLTASLYEELVSDCNVFSLSGCLICDCQYEEVGLYTSEGILCRRGTPGNECLLLDELPAGLYVAVIRSGSGSVRRKMLLQR